MKNKNTSKRATNAGLIVTAALVGAFASRYVDKVLTWPCPWDILGLIGSGLFLFFAVYLFWGKDLD
ncbi:MAG: hypothetical protein ACP5N3_03295 [Candidatus Nanoarchaeia archaeon]